MTDWSGKVKEEGVQKGKIEGGDRGRLSWPATGVVSSCRRRPATASFSNIWLQFLHTWAESSPSPLLGNRYLLRVVVPSLRTWPPSYLLSHSPKPLPLFPLNDQPVEQKKKLSDQSADLTFACLFPFACSTVRRTAPLKYTIWLHTLILRPLSIL